MSDTPSREISDPPVIQAEPENADIVRTGDDFVEDLYILWEQSEFQVKLLLLLCAWLILNLCLINVAWKVYSKRLTHVFMKGA